MSEESPFSVLCEDFSPGFQAGAEPNRLPDGATPDAKNAWFHTKGRNPKRLTMGRRPGTRLQNPVAMAAGQKVDGLFEFRQLASDPKLLAVCAGILHQFDNIDTFTAKTAPIWASGNPVRATKFRENLFLVDGTAMRRWDGTTAHELGTDKPTTAPTLTAGAAGALTGTYEGYGVWWDSVMDHESSPSDTSSQVTLTNQQRHWAKPGGAPGVAYDFWRIYCRRVDTNELNFFLTATVPIASASVDEEISDTARRDIGPRPNENDKPAGQFAILEQWKGFGVACRLNSDEFEVSKQGDLQSWHPKDRFPIQRGAGEPITTIKSYGEEVLIQKATQSWRLVGDRLPFNIRPVHSDYGNVSQESSVEIDNLYFGWDREKGPYATDLSNWRELSDDRLTEFMDTVTRSALNQIRCGHDKNNKIVFWSIPVNGSTRTRTILPYNYQLDTWLPPMTGLEWAAFTAFTNPSTGRLAVYAGDHWGRVFEMFQGGREGVPSTPATTLRGAPTAASATTLTDAGATFYTTGAGLAGLPIAVRSPAGEWQWRRIGSNTPTVITLDTVNDAPFTTVPVPGAGWLYLIGGIEWFWYTPVHDLGNPFDEKTYEHLYLEARSVRASDTLEVPVKINGGAAIQRILSFSFSDAAGGIWGVSLWGQALWGGSVKTPKKQELKNTVWSMQFGFQNYEPDQTIILTAYGLTKDEAPRRRANAK